MTHRTAQRYPAGTGMTRTICEVWQRKLFAQPICPGRCAFARLCFSLRCVAGKSSTALCGCCGSAVPPTSTGSYTPSCSTGASVSQHRPHPSARSAALLPALAPQFLWGSRRGKSFAALCEYCGSAVPPTPAGCYRGSGVTPMLCCDAAVSCPASRHRPCADLLSLLACLAAPSLPRRRKLLRSASLRRRG